VKWSAPAIVQLVQLVGVSGNAGQAATLVALKFGWHAIGVTHADCAHAWPLAHMFPQKPQFSVSARVSMHTPLHRLKPALHWQVPVEHVSFVPHATVQLPQNSGSLERSRH
jgi:hypothetical protein